MDSSYDLLVIGGGINGAGIARDAAGRGLSVVLCEQGDPAGATSSASSKLIHGGLRYLEHYEFRLVRESLREREILLRIAPHLMRSARFVLPHTPHTSSLRPVWMIRFGLALYDRLGGSRSLPASVSVDLTRPPWSTTLRPEYRNGFIYSDIQTDDARLVILNLRDAVEHGASVLDRTRFITARRAEGLWHVTLQDSVSGQPHEYRARVLVNAAGPWVAATLERLPPAHENHSIRLVKGSHIVVPRLYSGGHVFTLQQPDGRVVFLLPFEREYTLIGTTEIEHADPDTLPAITAAEIDYLCAAASRYLRTPVEATAVVWSFAGLRALFDDGSPGAQPGKITRDYHLQLDGGSDVDKNDAPLLSVFGGKLTTYRALAETVMAKLALWFPALGPAWTATAPLPGGDRTLHEVIAELHTAHPNLPVDWLEQLARRHGSRALPLLADVREMQDLGHDFGGGLYEIEVRHFIAHEWARHADDILWRRSKAGLHMTPDERLAFSQWLAAWSHHSENQKAN